MITLLDYGKCTNKSAPVALIFYLSFVDNVLLSSAFAYNRCMQRTDCFDLLDLPHY